jgi:NAD(P)-dependent dehydrogenase (short-subunit alcohol dehydrogenase family)
MIILITGASSGFGKLATQLLLAKDHTIIAGLRGGQKRLEETFPVELRRYPGKLFAVDLHMEKPETFVSAREYIQSKFSGKLDVLINNAGFGMFGALEDQTPEQLQRQFDVNFFGPMALSRVLLPALRAARGRILNVSSIAGRVALPFYGSYNASKFALEGMTESLYYELKPFGVQVGLIEPGGFRTEFTSRSKVFADASELYRGRTQALLRVLENSTARLGNPMRVARLIVKLCETSRVPVRSLVGVDAHFLALLKFILPSSVFMQLQYFVFRKVVFKD